MLWSESPSNRPVMNTTQNCTYLDPSPLPLSCKYFLLCHGPPILLYMQRLDLHAYKALCTYKFAEHASYEFMIKNSKNCKYNDLILLNIGRSSPVNLGTQSESVRQGEHPSSLCPSAAASYKEQNLVSCCDAAPRWHSLLLRGAIRIK